MPEPRRRGIGVLAHLKKFSFPQEFPTEPETWTTMSEIHPLFPIVSGLLIAKVEKRPGKVRRLRLETSSGAIEIRLPKYLRVVAQEELRVGESVRVWVKRNAKGLRAFGMVPLTPQPSLTLTPPSPRISVCTDKNCGRRGGREIFKELVKASHSVPDMQIRKCSCLRQCQFGPNIRIKGLGIEAVTPQNIPRLLERFELTPPPTE